MSFARRKPSETQSLPRRTSSLRNSSVPSSRSRTPSASVKENGDNGTIGGLDAIVESSPRKDASVSGRREAAILGGPLARKKSSAVIRGNSISSTREDTIKSNGSTTHPTVKDTARDIKSKPRPMSVSGIPSPSPSRSSTTVSTTRRDKYGSLASGEPRLRRTMSVRSVSDSHADPNRPVSNGVSNGMHSRMTSRDSSVSMTSSTTVVPPRSLKGVTGRESSKTTTILPGTMKQKATTETAVKNAPELPKSGIPISPKSQRAGSVIPPPSPKDTSKLSTHKTLPRIQPATQPSTISKPLKPQTSKPSLPKLTTTLTPTQPTSLKSQLSKEFSRSPSVTSSPKSLHPKSSVLSLREIPPDQHRLIQLLHLLPLSASALSTYESSAHETLSSRYRALQLRFERTQEHDHGMTLVNHLSELKMWSEGHIRCLAGLVVDWESLVGDLRGFCKRMVTTLKPVNKSVLQEKGNLPILRATLPPSDPFLLPSGLPFSTVLIVDRLLSRLNDIETSLSTLPGTGLPGTICAEIRENLGLLRKEMDMAITVAGLRWRSEVLQVEVKRMEIFNRMSLGKSSTAVGGQTGGPGLGICVWRE